MIARVTMMRIRRANRVVGVAIDSS
jgi:hypothetical protein